MKEALNIFKSLFKGREDIYATRWEKGTKNGYSPAYTFDPYSYKMHRMKGGTFQNYTNKQYQTLSDAGKDYDLAFGWSDDKIYCSELVWKIYQRATGIEVGKIQKLKEFDLSNDAVKQKMKERYGNNIPMNETVISPGAIFDSELLMTVKSQ